MGNLNGCGTIGRLVLGRREVHYIMRYIQYLNEYYVGRDKHYGYEVFVNPSPKEMNSYEDIRFIADSKTKKFFVSSLLLFHEDFVQFLTTEGQLKTTRFCFMGSGEVNQGKIIFSGYAQDYPTLVGGPKFAWAKKYFTEESGQWVVL